MCIRDRREKAQIANIARERVAVEKTVAEEEEAIETLRVVEDANRSGQAAVIMAEAEAQSEFVKDIKKAEAQEAAAGSLANERITMAKADLEAADLEARSMSRLAEGQQAQEAAGGLAKVQVKEANAVALEKEGLAEVRVKEADAVAIEKTGAAEAAAAEALLKGEAAGLIDKAEAMKALEGVGQEFEEFSRKLEVEKEVELAKVGATVGIANAQASALQAGLESADIDIVGGSDIFVDRLVGAITGGKQVEAFEEHSGESREKIIGELEGLLKSLGADDLRDMSAAAALKALTAKVSE